MNIFQFLFIMTAGLLAIGALVMITMFLYLVGPILLIFVVGYLLFEVIHHAME